MAIPIPYENDTNENFWDERDRENKHGNTQFVYNRELMGIKTKV